MRKLILAILLALFTPVANAAHVASFYVIPVAGHTPGAFNTMWASDVAIQNIQAEPLEVSFVFVQSGDAGFDNAGPLDLRVNDQSVGSSVTVPARGSVLLRDVVAGYRGLSAATGAILVGASRPFTVSSRAYNQTTGVGQGVTAVRDFLDNSLGTSDNSGLAYVPGIVSSSATRTNLGFVAATSNTSGSMSISVTVRNAAGASLGSRTFTLPAGGALQHLQFPVGSIASGGIDIGSAEFQIVSGSGAVVPYASVVDNATADAVFVAGVFPPNTTSSALAKSVVPSAFEAVFDRLLRD